ncbi:MAG: alpha-L-fucosidase [Chitinophagaceae bacterium]|nr:alpha-L-fucosidase [Chitinophagaceae bacterium]
MKKIQLTLIASFILFAVSAQQNNYMSIEAGDSEKEIISKAANIVPTPRQLRWQQLELTAFFHFGVNTFTGNEWGTGKEDPKIFDPTALDARQWVRIAKEAGIKQVILTAKHHDGFCLWPTKTTTHSVAASPWKNGKGDLVKEVSKACKEMNIGFGIYLSPWDMNSPHYGNNEKYNDFFINQLTELLTNYGKVDEVWFDGAKGEGVNQEYYFDKWYQHIRQLQPQAVIAIMGPDVRWVGTETGYGRETEWSVVPVNNLNQTTIAAGSQKDIAFKPQGDMRGDDLGSREKIVNAKGLVWYPAETDVSIRPGWFYHEAEDSKVKSPEKLLDIYFNSVGRNGVLLLNIPPDKRGLIHKSDIAALKQWKQLRDDIFKTNLAKGSMIKSANGVNTEYILDGNNATHFTTKGNDTTSVIELQLKSPALFNVLQLQENIKMGQRIERFELNYWDGMEWKMAANGTTIGYKRLLRFNTITTDRVRLRILSSRLNPYLAELGLFYIKELRLK